MFIYIRVDARGPKDPDAVLVGIGVSRARSARCGGLGTADLQQEHDGPLTWNWIILFERKVYTSLINTMRQYTPTTVNSLGNNRAVKHAY